MRVLKVKLAWFVVIAAMVGAPLYAAKANETPKGPVIRVLLTKSAPSVLLEAKGGYSVIRPETGLVLTSGSVGKRYVIHAIEEGLRWGEEFPGVSRVKVVPTNKETLLYVSGYQYRGAVEIFVDRNRTITVVNELPIEEYLRSTLAIKFDKPLSSEAMSAMVIAARTEAYAKVLAAAEEKSSDWDVKASEEEYFGAGVGLQKNGVDEAIEHTRFMVLSTALGRPLEQVHLLGSKVEELAEGGQDAKRILKSLYPHSHLTVTAYPEMR